MSGVDRIEVVGIAIRAPTFACSSKSWIRIAVPGGNDLAAAEAQNERPVQLRTQLHDSHAVPRPDSRLIERLRAQSPSYLTKLQAAIPASRLHIRKDGTPYEKSPHVFRP